MHDYHRAIEGPLLFIPPRNLKDLRGLPKAAIAILEANRIFSAKYAAEARQRKDWESDNAFDFVGADCIDGRRLCAEYALGEIHEGRGGVPAGVIRIDRSSGNINGYSSLATCLIERYRVRRGRPIMLCETAHHSSSQGGTASCATWNNNTEAAVRMVGFKTEESHFAFSGKIVAFHALADTDDDSLIVFGPQGAVNTASFAADFRLRGKNLRSAIEKNLKGAFPDDWPPLAALPPATRRLFVPELAQYLAWNVAFVRRNIRNGCQPKLTHDEQILVVGRHVAPLWGLKAFFCGDHSLRLKHDVRTAQPFVALNAAKAAVEAGERDWTVPALINQPHDGDDDIRLTQLHVRHMKTGIERIMRANAAKAAEFVLSGLPKSHRPDWLMRDLAHLGTRLHACTSVSDRISMRLEPFV